ncbi:MAG: POTRA domain-containing protein [Crocinitomicaceae bacterium]
MRRYYFFFILLLSFTSYSQKAFQLSFANENHRAFVKNPTTSFKDSVSLVKYVRDLQSSAINKGYLLASVDKFSFSNKTATLDFHLGEKFEEAHVNMNQEEMSFIRKHSNLNERFISQLAFTPKVLSSTLKSIQRTYLENGYPFVRLQFEDVVIQGAQMSAELKVDRGKLYVWEEIHIKGDSSIAKSYVSSLLGIKEGDVFDESLLKKIKSRVQQVSFIKEIKPHEILFAKTGAELFVYLKSNPVSSVNGVVGLQPNPVTQRVLLTGELNLKLLNVLKQGELVDIRWQSIRDQTQSLNARMNYPFLFKTSFGLDGNFDLYRRDTSFVELRSTIGVQYFMSHGSYIKAFYQNLQSNVLSGGQNNPTFANLGSTASNNYGLAYARQSLDYLPNPSTGHQFEVMASAGTRSFQSSDTSEVVSSLILKGEIDAQVFIPLAKRHVLRVANHTEFYNTDEIFQNELFRFGGLTSQRGFDEDELVASTLSTTTLEYRFLLDQNSHVFAFFDQTWYENNSTNYVNDLPLGFGAGFSFSTNLGVFSISYALGKQLNNPVLLSNSKVHFGYIAYF